MRGARPRGGGGCVGFGFGTGSGSGFGAVGGALAYVYCDGATLSTLNFNTFSQVAFDFRVTAGLLARGLVVRFAPSCPAVKGGVSLDGLLGREADARPVRVPEALPGSGR